MKRHVLRVTAISSFASGASFSSYFFSFSLLEPLIFLFTDIKGRKDQMRTLRELRWGTDPSDPVVVLSHLGYSLNRNLTCFSRCAASAHFHQQLPISTLCNEKMKKEAKAPLTMSGLAFRAVTYVSQPIGIW